MSDIDQQLRNAEAHASFIIAPPTTAIHDKQFGSDAAQRGDAHDRFTIISNLHRKQNRRASLHEVQSPYGSCLGLARQHGLRSMHLRLREVRAHREGNAADSIEATAFQSLASTELRG